MSVLSLGLLGLFVFLLPLPVLGAGAIIINEIAWMGSLPKTGETATQAANNEWIELKNTTSALINLNGWKLTAQDGAPDIILDGVITASGFFLLERTSDDTIPGIQADQIYVGALSNSGERLFLKNASGEIVNEANASSGWPAGDNDTKQTMQFAGSVWVTASSTPRAENSAIAPSPSPETGSSTQTQSLPVQQTAPPADFALMPGIKVYAGEDKIVAAGSITEFMGEAIDAKNEPLINPRFWWNFGDGASKEGRLVSHIFQIPGKYTVGMHVSSGLSVSSDYIKVEVVPNQIRVKSVLVGEGGYLTLFNPTDIDLDIGEWLLEDNSGKKFIMPSRTKIGAKSEISLANSLTGFTQRGIGSVTLRYPNSLPAFEWKEEVVKVSSTFKSIGSSQGQIVKTAVVEKEIPAVITSSSTAAQELVPGRSEQFGLAQISGPSFNFSSKIFFFSAFIISIISASLYLVIKIF